VVTSSNDLRFDGQIAVISVPNGPADEMSALFTTIMSD
jgi:hypothetical protein